MEAGQRKKVVILGSGQLGRMLALAGYPLGIECICIDDSKEQAIHPLVPYKAHTGSITPQIEEILREAASVTFEFENFPLEFVREVEKRKTIYPPASALASTQERFAEKKLFTELGIPTAEYVELPSDHTEHNSNVLREKMEQWGLPLVVKLRRLGYDGKGQVIIRNEQDYSYAQSFIMGKDSIAERYIPFEREISIISVRSIHGEILHYPLTQNFHEQGILQVSIAPAPRITSSLQEEAQEYSRRILERFNYVGVMALELFESGNKLIANEVAPRVHNSGHWTLNGCSVSQFENHMRAIMGLPLGTPDMRGSSLMINIIGQEIDPVRVLSEQGAHLHWYGKSVRKGRKLGHININCPDQVTLREKFDRLASHCGLSAAIEKVRVALS